MTNPVRRMHYGKLAAERPALRMVGQRPNPHVLWYLAIVMICCLTWLFYTVFLLALR
jgi:hypothetical protein